MRLIPALFVVTTLLHAAPPFTIDQILSSPFPAALQSNAQGTLIWTQATLGVHNLWIAQPPAYQGHPLTRFTQDDGQEIIQLNITESTVAYTRGEATNAKGEFPNPRHLIASPEQTVFTISTSGGQPHEVGKGHHPALSPDSKIVAFVNAGQVWSAPVDGSAKPQQLIHARGDAESLVWSPNGELLAFTSVRVQHSFIAIYSPSDQALRYLDPSVDNDENPAWAPDSKQLAFTRIPTTQQAFPFGPHRTNLTPWSIRVADSTTGKSHEVWHAQPGPGSEFRELDADHQLLWAAGDRIIFPSERTGFLHLNAVTLKADNAIDLTPGSFEVEHMALSPDRRTIAYSSNENDTDRRHNWRVSANGGAPQRLTGSTDIEWSPAFAGNQIGFLRADARQPARASIWNKSETQNLDAHWLPADFPAPAALVEPQPVIVTAADGLHIHAQLFLPRDGRKQHPAVIFFHGGSRRQMLLGWHYMFYYNQAYGFNQYLASRGYVVLSVNYRSGIGYGLDFREALNFGATGASEYNDVIGAGLYLRSRPDVIPDKIGLWGGSYGGYLTALGLARASNLFAAGVDLHGVHDWNAELAAPASPDLARIAFQSSPMASVDTWKSPVLLIQGDDDRNVNFQQTLMLAEALRLHHVEFEQLIFPDEIHDFLLHQNWLAAYHATDDFLARHLVPK